MMIIVSMIINSISAQNTDIICNNDEAFFQNAQDRFLDNEASILEIQKDSSSIYKKYQEREEFLDSSSFCNQIEESDGKSIY